MGHVTEEMQKAGLEIPIMVGGATTSRIHTALKIAPHYSNPVIHVRDASQNPLIAAQLLNPATREAYINKLNEEYASLRQCELAKNTPFIPIQDARSNRLKPDFNDFKPIEPTFIGRKVINITLEDVIPYINWRQFFTAWKMPGDFASLAH